MVWQARYEPFGAVQQVSAVDQLHLRLHGQWLQLETGLAYNWHRHYDATLGRYTRPDPLGFVDAPNVYNYARRSPLIITDSSGLSPKQ